MPSKIKIDKVADLSDKLAKAKSVVLTDYRGLSVAQLDDLRKKVEVAGASYEVTKNTLLSRSLGSKEVPAEALEGPTATLFAYQDEIAPLKALQDFIKANNLPTVKVGYLGQSLLTSLQVSELARLPSRAELLGKLARSLKSNEYRLVGVLSGNIRKLVYVLSGVAKTKS